MAVHRCAKAFTLIKREPQRKKRPRDFLSELFVQLGDQTRTLLEHFDGLHARLADCITGDAYGLIMSRRDLLIAERELANVIVLFVHGYRRQLYSHLRGALRVGVTPFTLKSVLNLVGGIAGKDARGATETVDLICQNRKRGSF